MAKVTVTRDLKEKLSILMAVLSVMGIVTFSLFILQESFQTVMFGSWPAQDAGDWRQVRRGVLMMRATARTINIVNYSVGWIQPLAFISYRSYAKSAQYYLESLEKKTFARAPELFIGERVEFAFYPKQIKNIRGAREATNGKIRVILSKTPERGQITVSGVLRIDSEGRLVIDTRKGG